MTLDAKALTAARAPYTGSERKILIGLAADLQRVITKPPKAGFYSIMISDHAILDRNSSHRIGQMFQPKVVERLVGKGLLRDTGDGLLRLTSSGTAVAAELEAETAHPSANEAKARRSR